MTDLDVEPTPYVPRRPSRSLWRRGGGIDHHLRAWGAPEARPIVLVHGAMDSSITFQFLVDALAEDWFVVAPDLRGYGESGRAPNYAFADYLLDLDGLLAEFFGDRPVPLVGHSLGGNVVSVYAGVRPARASHVVSLDGFGLPERPAADAPDHLARWLDRWASPPEERTYPDWQNLADRLRQTNPRLDPARARFLAGHLGREVPDGVVWRFDPRHRLPFSSLFRLAEWEACLVRVTAPVTWVGSGRPVPTALAADPDELPRRAALAGAAFHHLPHTGHNLHHDAPEAVARLLEDALRRA